MKRLLLLLVLVALVWVGYLLLDSPIEFSQREVVKEDVAKVEMPNVIVEELMPQEPEEPLGETPEDVVYVLKPFSVINNDGIKGFAEGKEVRLVRKEAGYYVVSDGETEARKPVTWFTRDAALAKEMRERRAVAQSEMEKQRMTAEAARAAEKASADDVKKEPKGLPPLRIGTWNLEFLGARKDPPRTPADMQAIADFIKHLNVQVLGVNEVNGRRPLEDLCRRLGRNWKFVVGTSGRLSQTEQIAPGILWDASRVNMLGAGELTDLSRETDSVFMFHRKPVTASFRDRAGGPDFRVIVVHLKAGRSQTDNQKRSGELARLRQYLEKLTSSASEDKDIVVLGDFNHDFKAHESRTLEDQSFSHYLTKEGVGRSIMHFNAQIDQIVPLATFNEVRSETFHIHSEQGMQDLGAWRKTYSDHFPVTVELEGLPDDDPKAIFSSQGKSLR